MFRPSSRAAVLTCAGLLGACASTPPAQQWSLNGRTPGQFEADRAYCQSVAASAVDTARMQAAGGGMARGGGMAALGGLLAALELAQSEGVFDRCMQSRGYSQGR